MLQGASTTEELLHLFQHAKSWDFANWQNWTFVSAVHLQVRRIHKEGGIVRAVNQSESYRRTIFQCHRQIQLLTP